MDYWDDEFEWDEEKSRRNRRLHGIDFEAAAMVFDDDKYVESVDDRREYGEERLLRIGLAYGMLLSVVYVRRGERKRLISARLATTTERREYAETGSR